MAGEGPGIRTREARAADAATIAAIYAIGIEERQATFETRPASPEEFAHQIERGDLLLVAERDGEVVAWAAVLPYSDPHDYYAGVGEATLYVAPKARRGNVGATLLDALAEGAERRGYWKLVGKVFTTTSRASRWFGAAASAKSASTAATATSTVGGRTSSSSSACSATHGGSRPQASRLRSRSRRHRHPVRADPSP